MFGTKERTLRAKGDGRLLLSYVCAMSISSGISSNFKEISNCAFWCFGPSGTC